MADPALPVESFSYTTIPPTPGDEASLVNSVLSYGGVSTELTCCFVAEVCVFIIMKICIVSLLFERQISRE